MVGSIPIEQVVGSTGMLPAHLQRCEKMAKSIYDQLASRPISGKLDVQTGEILDA
jgi:hypothetical protein